MAEEKLQIITQNTLVPLSVIACICGAVVWMTTLYAQGVSNAKDIAETKQTQAVVNEDIATMKSDIAFIRGLLEKRHGPKGGL